MKNKKTIMTISALLILIFHLWINVTISPYETYIKQLCVVGVDLFFFISTYGLAKKSIKYKEFILNRLNNIYLKYLIFSIIAAIFASWSISKFLLTITGIDLFVSGGGSFLWFIPGIMIMYLIIPIYKFFDNKKPKLTLIITIIIYLISSILISIYTDYTEIFILTNRIPIMLFGYYTGKYNIIDNLEKNKMLYIIISVTLLLIGLFISTEIVINRFSLSWYVDIIYIMNIPLELGLILTLNKINANNVINLIGKSTLELYGLQMIFGFYLANKIYLLVQIPLLCNILIVLLFCIASILLNKIFLLKDRIIRKTMI